MREDYKGISRRAAAAARLKELLMRGCSANGGHIVAYETILRFFILLIIVSFTVWGLAGLMLSLRNKRSTLRAWWWGSHYGTGEARA